MKARDLGLVAACAVLAFLPGASWSARAIAAVTAAACGLAGLRLWGSRGVLAALAAAVALPPFASPSLLVAAGAVASVAAYPPAAPLALALAAFAAGPRPWAFAAAAGALVWGGLAFAVVRSAGPVEADAVRVLPAVVVAAAAVGLFGGAIVVPFLHISTLAGGLAVAALVAGAAACAWAASVGWRTGALTPGVAAAASIVAAGYPLGVVVGWDSHRALAVAIAVLAVHGPVALAAVVRGLPRVLRLAVAATLASAWGLALRLS